MAVLAGAVSIVALALIFGSTLTLRPRDGIQPIEFQDVAFYSVLGADLAETGTETIYTPSGFTRPEGLPAQTWYHRGEIWLASAAILIFGMAPIDARHFVVLPLLLLAAAALTGTLVRRMTGAASRGAFLWVGRLPFLRRCRCSRASTSIYGTSASSSRSPRTAWPSWPFCSRCTVSRDSAGSAADLDPGHLRRQRCRADLAAHIAIAVLALVGIGFVWTIRVVRSLAVTRRFPVVAPVWRRTFIVTGIAIVTTVGWGLLTGHSVGGSGLSPSVTPFDAAWREAIATTILGAGAFLAIVVAWLMVAGARRSRRICTSARSRS